MTIPISQRVHLRTLCVGFEAHVLGSIRAEFDVQCVISEGDDADVNWHDLHNLRVEPSAPQMSPHMLDCFRSLCSKYLQFVDINSRRHYYVPGRESEIYNGFVVTFCKVYQILLDQKIELVLHANIPHEGFDFVLHQVSLFLEIPSVLCYQSLIPNRFWMSGDAAGFGLHSQMPAINAQEASGYELPRNWFYMKGSKRDAAYSFSQLVAEVARRPRRLPPTLIRYFYAWRYRRDVKSVTSSRIDGAPYVYFPLHLQPELTTSAVGGTYADQLLALEVLSARMPEGHFIYVKENPKQTEKQRGPLFYKRLRALKNVQVVPLRESSSDLIRGSLAVATITGTAGWEALFHGKPVLVFGSAWYREFPGVTTFTDGLNVSEFLRTVPPDEAEIVSFLDQSLTIAGRGIVDPAYAQLVPSYSDEQNARDVATSLARHVRARLGATKAEAI
jgi:Capsule polysaccharide biosynthesis protein